MPAYITFLKRFQVFFGQDRPKSAVLLVDSGTTFFTAPRRLFNKISEKVWPMNCDKIHTLPEFVFTVPCLQISDFLHGKDMRRQRMFASMHDSCSTDVGPKSNRSEALGLKPPNR